MQESLELVGNRLQEIWSGVQAAIPLILVGVLIFFLGLFLANLLRVLTEKIMPFLNIPRTTKTDRSIQNTPLIAGNFVYWTVVFLTVVLILNVFGITLTESVVTRLLQVVPGIIVALIILVFGLFLALLVEKASLKLLPKAKTLTSKIWPRIFKWSTLFFALVLALQQLGLAAQFVLSLLQILVAAAAVALALAFGIGCKDIARDIVLEFFRSEKEGV